MRHALFLAALVACEPFGPPVPPGLVAFPPRPEYAVWYDSVEACSHRHGALAQLEWFYWPADSGRYLPAIESPRALGFYDRGRRAIWLVESDTANEFVVKHEMLHSLLPHAGHPAEFDWCQLR